MLSKIRASVGRYNVRCRLISLRLASLHNSPSNLKENEQQNSNLLPDFHLFTPDFAKKPVEEDENVLISKVMEEPSVDLLESDSFATIELLNDCIRSSDESGDYCWKIFQQVLLTSSAADLTFEEHYLALIKKLVSDFNMLRQQFRQPDTGTNIPYPIQQANNSLLSKLNTIRSIITENSPDLKQQDTKHNLNIVCEYILRQLAYTGDTKACMLLVKEMIELTSSNSDTTPEPPISTYNSLLLSYFVSGEVVPAFKFFEKMVDRSKPNLDEDTTTTITSKPNATTFLFLVQGCVLNNLFDKALEYWNLQLKLAITPLPYTNVWFIKTLLFNDEYRKAWDHTKSLKVQPKDNHILDYCTDMIITSSLTADNPKFALDIFVEHYGLEEGLKNIKESLLDVPEVEQKNSVEDQNNAPLESEADDDGFNKEVVLEAESNPTTDKTPEISSEAVKEVDVGKDDRNQSDLGDITMEEPVMMEEENEFNDLLTPSDKVKLLYLLTKNYCATNDLKYACQSLSEFSLNYSPEDHSRLFNSKLNPLSDLSESVIKLACVENNAELAEQVVLDLQRNHCKLSASSLEALVELYVKQENIDEAIQLVMTFTNTSTPLTSLSSTSGVPASVYNYLLAGLASQYRMDEFTDLFQSLRDEDLLTEISRTIAFEAYLRANDAEKSFEVCRLLFDENESKQETVDREIKEPEPAVKDHGVKMQSLKKRLEKITADLVSNEKTLEEVFEKSEEVPIVEKAPVASIESLLKLFELVMISKKYSPSSQVFKWLRLTLKHSTLTEEQHKELWDLIKTRVTPLSEYIRDDLLASVSRAESEETSTKPQQQLQKEEPALQIFKEFVTNRIELPDSVYIAVIKFYQHKSRDFVGVAKTWAALAKIYRGKKWNKPPKECVDALLDASISLCGSKSSKSVLSLIETEKYDMKTEGDYKKLLLLACKFGHEEECVKLLIEAHEKKAEKTEQSLLTPDLYGYVEAMLTQYRRFAARAHVTDFMERTYPEVVSGWWDVVDEKLKNEVNEE